MEHAIKMALSFQRGEQEGFEYLFNEHFDNLTGYAYKFLKDIELCKDVTERAFLVIWERREWFSHHLVIQDYLYTTVRNQCLNLLNRKKLLEEKCPDIARYETHRLSTEEADHTLLKSETQRLVSDWLNTLPVECRKIMKLLYVDGLSAREVANHLGLSISTVKNQKGRAIDIIKSFVNGKGKRRENIISLPQVKSIEPPIIPPVTEKPKFIPWRKKGRPKEECVWKPNERNEKIYTMFKDGKSYQELSEIFDLCLQVIANIVRDEHKSIRVKELFIKGKRVMDIPRVVKLSLKETIERINHAFKIELHEDNNRQCLATYKAIIKDYPHLQEKERAGGTGCPEAQYGSFA